MLTLLVSALSGIGYCQGFPWMLSWDVQEFRSPGVVMVYGLNVNLGNWGFNANYRNWAYNSKTPYRMYLMEMGLSREWSLSHGLFVAPEISVGYASCYQLNKEGFEYPRSRDDMGSVGIDFRLGYRWMALNFAPETKVGYTRFTEKAGGGLAGFWQAGLGVNFIIWERGSNR